MRVALNALLFSRSRSYRGAGISRVLHHLLAELGRDPRGNQYDVFVPEEPQAGDDVLGPGLRFHAVGAGSELPRRRILWEQAVLPRTLAALKPDLFHGGAFALPIAWRRPSVVTIYDLSFLRFPRAFKPGNRLYLTAATRLAAHQARRAITISEHSRRDIATLLGMPLDRVDVAYPAANARYRPLPAQEVEAFRRANDLPERFIFYLGTLEPRKNLHGLLEAYARLGDGRPPLYVAGAAGWQYSPIFETVRRLGLARSVQFLGFVEEHALPLWYNAAWLFAFPSLYEGFGLPVLEAMACGTPVMTSNVASIPEVAGPAAALVDPRDPAAMAEALARGVDDRVWRDAAMAAGLQQARAFTWRAMADETVRSYQRAMMDETRRQGPR